MLQRTVDVGVAQYFAPYRHPVLIALFIIHGVPPEKAQQRRSKAFRRLNVRQMRCRQNHHLGGGDLLLQEMSVTDRGDRVTFPGDD